MRLFRSPHLPIILGVLASNILTLIAGRNNSSFILKAVFAVWVSLPYLMLAGTTLANPEKLIRRLTWTACVSSALIYTIAIFRPARAQAAFPFVALPLAQIIVIAATLGMAAWSRRRT